MTTPAANSLPGPACPGLRLLLVDDEERILRSLRRSLRRVADEVLTAASGEEALALLESGPAVHVVVSDFRMPGMDGVELLRVVKDRWPAVQRVMLTGYADQRAIEDAINRSEVYRFVSKPWDDGQLQMTICSAWEQWRLTEENRRLFQLTQEQNTSLEAKVAQRTRMLSQAKAEWELSFDAIHDPLAVIDSSCRIKRANLAFAHAGRMDVRDVIGQPCYAVLLGREARCENCTLDQVLATGEPGHASASAYGRHYRMSLFRLPHVEGEPARAVAYYRDVTEEERITRQLFQTEKMAAVGQLAGGVAHEINNPLAGILAFAQMMRADERSSDDDEQLRYIEESARRAMRIVESLLHFSRPGDMDPPAEVDLDKLFSHIRVLSQSLIKGTHLTLELSFDEDTPPLVASINQLEQVLMNLVTNAAQAMDRAGTIRVHAGRGPHGVRIGVEDSGPGVPEAVRAKIFEPFFTTKPEGQGTGLGLSICYRIVESHRGRLAVGTSEALGGARFTIDLPASERGQ